MEESDSIPSEIVSLIRLIAAPDTYDGRQISVVGYCVLKFEVQGLFLSESDYRHGVGKNALWLNTKLTSDLDPFHERYVLVEGVFVANHRGHLGLYSGAVSSIVRIVAWGTGQQMKMYSNVNP